jgi:hypothetical protein
MSRNAEFNAGREPTQAIKVWGSDLGYVPVEHLERLAFQRLRYDPSVLVDSIKEEGIKEPLHVEYDINDHLARLAEGNHRLQAAKMAGLTHVPVVVHRHQYGLPNGAPVTESEDFPREPGGYVKGDFHPRHIGLDKPYEGEDKVSEIQTLLRPHY